MRNLLVPIDFGDASNLVIEKAGELARELPARIVLLHVDEPRAYASLGDAATLVAAWPLETPKRISKLKARLTSLANPLRASGIEVDSVAIVGLVVDDILEQAQDIVPTTSFWVPMAAFRRVTSSVETSSPAF